MVIILNLKFASILRHECPVPAHHEGQKVGCLGMGRVMEGNHTFGVVQGIAKNLTVEHKTH